MWGFLGSRGGDKNPEWGIPTNVGGVMTRCHMTRCHMTSDWMSHSKGRKTKKWNKPISNVSPAANMTLFLVLGDKKNIIDISHLRWRVSQEVPHMRKEVTKVILFFGLKNPCIYVPSVSKVVTKPEWGVLTNANEVRHDVTH